MSEKFFTPKQANGLLPEVRKIVEELLQKAREAKALTAEPVSHDREGQIIDVDRRLKSLMARLAEIGCYYKDWNFEVGLVDFPAIIHGQEALLCWRSDELQVSWFHGLTDGYAGRRPITKELVFS